MHNTPYIPISAGFCKGPDNNRLYYEVHGESGPWVILVYGVACLMNHWIYQTAELSKNHRVLLFDYRGHHQSEAHINMGMDYVAHDLKAIMSHLGIAHAHLVGHSFGVPVVCRFNILYPELSLGNVLINGFVYNPLDELFRAKVSQKLITTLTSIRDLAPHLSQWLWKKAVNNFFTQITCGVLGGFNLERVPFKDIEIYTQGLENLQIQTMLTYMNELVQMDLREDLDHIPTPTLIISGLRDGITPTHQQDLMHALLENSEIIKIKEGSHCTQLDFPDTTNQLILNFLKSTRQSS